jgi:hypothetical protein
MILRSALCLDSGLPKKSLIGELPGGELGFASGCTLSEGLLASSTYVDWTIEGVMSNIATVRMLADDSVSLDLERAGVDEMSGSNIETFRAGVVEAIDGWMSGLSAFLANGGGVRGGSSPWTHDLSSGSIEPVSLGNIEEGLRAALSAAEKGGGEFLLDAEDVCDSLGGFRCVSEECSGKVSLNARHVCCVCGEAFLQERHLPVGVFECPDDSKKFLVIRNTGLESLEDAK